MNRNRYLLCLLLSGWMIYYAVPKLQITNSGIEGYFAISWTMLALMVIAGNLQGLLYAPKQRKNIILPQRKHPKKKVRSFQ